MRERITKKSSLNKSDVITKCKIPVKTSGALIRDYLSFNINVSAKEVIC